MPESFTKLFSSIITSTVWSHDSDTKVVWVTMLALADKNGEVQGSVPGLARLAGVSVEACERALEAFLASDRYSRTQDYEGRRIEEIPGGWSLLNYAKYRKMASVDDQMEKGAERARRYRANKAGRDCAGDRDDTVTSRDASRDITQITPEAEAEAEAEAELKPEGLSQADGQQRQKRARSDDERIKLPADWRSTPDDRAYASDKGLDPESTGAAFTDYFVEGRGRNEKRTIAGWSKRYRIWCNTDAARRPAAPGGAGVRPAGRSDESSAFARAAAILAGGEHLRGR